MYQRQHIPLIIIVYHTIELPFRIRVRPFSTATFYQRSPRRLVPILFNTITLTLLSANNPLWLHYSSKTHTDTLNQITARSLFSSCIILSHWDFIYKHNLLLRHHYIISHSFGSIVASITPTLRIQVEPVPLNHSITSHPYDLLTLSFPPTPRIKTKSVAAGLQYQLSPLLSVLNGSHPDTPYSSPAHPTGSHYHASIHYSFCIVCHTVLSHRA